MMSWTDTKLNDGTCVPIVLFFIALHGSGYIAAFTGGLLFGFLAKDATHKLLLAAEGTGETLALVTWLLFLVRKPVSIVTRASHISYQI